MSKLIATLIRELLLLVRDRAGLILLFVMPAALVLVITLVQNEVFKHSGGLQISGIVVDLDGGPAAQAVVKKLEGAESLKFVKRIDGLPVDEARALRAVGAGDYQFCVVLPKGLSAAMQQQVYNQISRMLAPDKTPAPTAPPVPEVRLHFDPAIRGAYRLAVSGRLKQAVASVQAGLQIHDLLEGLQARMDRMAGEMAGPFGAGLSKSALPDLEADLGAPPEVKIKELTAGPARYAVLPTAIQQNVPAWALFGMFFIVVPLGGSLVVERSEGILERLMTMPVFRLTLLMGKLGAYVLICLVQFIFVWLVGKTVLPLLGTATLELGSAVPAVALVALCSALAASGFGILLGTLANTQEQVTTLGPVAVVIAAALGGIMVPVFAMPHVMQSISRFSPLAWAHDAFMDLLVRGGTLSNVRDQLVLLLLFFGGCMVVALMVMQRRHG